MSTMDYPQNQPESYVEYILNGTQENKVKADLIKEEAFLAMQELQGWCGEHKASILIDLILASKPQTIVEIGVFGGKSLIPMAFALQANGKGKIYGIDPWSSQESIKGMDEANSEWWGSLDHDEILIGLLEKIKKFRLQDHVSLTRATSEQAPIINNIDILHIDGNHSDKHSYLDVTKWVPLVRKGGIIIIGDVSWAIDGKVSQYEALKWVDERCYKVEHFKDEGEWAIWIKE
jgi:predicted O-methyltransferase YrrM